MKNLFVFLFLSLRVSLSGVRSAARVK